MAIRIGAPPENGFENPLGLLKDCHRRIERFLEQLVRVTEQARGGAMSEEQREALEVALRYFEKATPMHMHDEEESLFPRMRAAGTPAALAALAALEADHRAAEEVHAEVEGLAHEWLAHGVLSQECGERLLDQLRRLREMYREHIAIEDTRVFPLAGKTLAKPAIEEVGREMAARRGLDPDHLPAINRCAQRRLDRAVTVIRGGAAR